MFQKSTLLRYASVMAGVGLFALPGISRAGEFETSLSAFSDITYGVLRGKPAQATQGAAFGAGGEDAFVKNSNQGFGLVGTDFVLTTELDDRFVYLAEVNLQAARGRKDEIELDVERMFLEYRILPQLNIQAGLFFTPIGYFNRNLYARAWMMISAQIPDLFEEENNFVPTHTTGVHAHGIFDLGRSHLLKYAVSVGNGRNTSPDKAVYARDDDGWRTTTAMLEWLVPAFRSTTLGVSGWYDRISSFYIPTVGGGDSTLNPAAQGLRLTEVGVDAHLAIFSNHVNLIGEYLYQQHRDRDNVLPATERNGALQGAFVELSANLLSTGALKPYVRFDYVKLPQTNGGPYLGLRGDGDDVVRVFVPRTAMLMGGLSYDFAPRVRVKVEYSEALAGARAKHGLMLQTAFAF